MPGENLMEFCFPASETGVRRPTILRETWVDSSHQLCSTPKSRLRYQAIESYTSSYMCGVKKSTYQSAFPGAKARLALVSYIKQNVWPLDGWLLVRRSNPPGAQLLLTPAPLLLKGERPGYDSSICGYACLLNQ
jgi:hypothetical protein